MDTPTPDGLIAQLREQQAAVARTADQLRERLSPESLAQAAKDKAAASAKAAALTPEGRPKLWLMVAVAALAALVAIGVAARVSRRRK
jgi:hypothetical protein